MSLSIGIVGLPNVGKSTLFNALTKNQAKAENYPFCTIEPNVGIIPVPDEKLQKIAEVITSSNPVIHPSSYPVIPAVVEFVDIAGLVAGAAKGEGLGNQFLANIRECDAICEVVRVFKDTNVIHVAGEVNPDSDVKTIETELALKDIETIDKRIYSLEKDIKAGSKEAKTCSEILSNIRISLEKGEKPTLSDDDKLLIKELGLLSLKPVIYVMNFDEKQLQNYSSSEARSLETNSSHLEPRTINHMDTIVLSAKVEAELNELSDEEKKEYLSSLGIEKSGIETLASKAYEVLGLQTYYTSGEKETRAWTIKKGATAPQAAGVIHGDFERGFIAADIVKYDDFIANGGWQGAREKGLVKTQGKDYVMQPDDIVLFKFNV